MRSGYIGIRLLISYLTFKTSDFGIQLQLQPQRTGRAPATVRSSLPSCRSALCFFLIFLHRLDSLSPWSLTSWFSPFVGFASKRFKTRCGASRPRLSFCVFHLGAPPFKSLSSHRFHPSWLATTRPLNLVTPRCIPRSMSDWVLVSWGATIVVGHS